MQSISHLLPTGPADMLLHRAGQRRSARFPLDAHVDVYGPTFDAHGFVLNASEGGLRVALDRAYDDGSVLVLDVLFASGVVSRERARVMWSRALSDGCVLGLRFEAA